MGTLIQLDKICKAYPMAGGDVHALRDVSLTFEEGEFVSIVGASGSGKSTLLYLIGLLSTPTSGAHKFRGSEVGQLSDIERSKLRASDIGFVFQSFHLVAQLNVLDNVLLGARYSENGGGRGKLKKRARELLERVGLSKRLRHRPGELSNGEMQRVAIARSLIGSPGLLLADEPTGNLDEKTGDEIFDLLQSLQQDGATVVMVTHNMALANRAPRMVTLKDGGVVE